jgi:hypothetical protein
MIPTSAWRAAIESCELIGSIDSGGFDEPITDRPFGAAFVAAGEERALTVEHERLD